MRSLREILHDEIFANTMEELRSPNDSYFFFFFCLGLEKCTDHNCNSNTLRAMISNFTFVLSQSTPRDNTDYSGEKQHIKTTANKILNQYKFNLLFKM